MIPGTYDVKVIFADSNAFTQLGPARLKVESSQANLDIKLHCRPKSASSVSGKVQSNTLVPISSAKVTFINNSPGSRCFRETYTTTTDNQGKYAFSNLDSASYKIKVEKSGYNSRESNYTLQPGTNTTPVITLTPLNASSRAANSAPVYAYAYAYDRYWRQLFDTAFTFSFYDREGKVVAAGKGETVIKSGRYNYVRTRFENIDLSRAKTLKIRAEKSGYESEERDIILKQMRYQRYVYVSAVFRLHPSPVKKGEKTKETTIKSQTINGITTKYRASIANQVEGNTPVRKALNSFTDELNKLNSKLKNRYKLKGFGIIVNNHLRNVSLEKNPAGFGLAWAISLNFSHIPESRKETAKIFAHLLDSQYYEIYSRPLYNTQRSLARYRCGGGIISSEAVSSKQKLFSEMFALLETEPATILSLWRNRSIHPYCKNSIYYAANLVRSMFRYRMNVAFAAGEAEPLFADIPTVNQLKREELDEGGLSFEDDYLKAIKAMDPQYTRVTMNYADNLISEGAFQKDAKLYLKLKGFWCREKNALSELGSPFVWLWQKIKSALSGTDKFAKIELIPTDFSGRKDKTTLISANGYSPLIEPEYVEPKDNQLNLTLIDKETGEIIYTDVLTVYSGERGEQAIATSGW